MKVNFRQAMWSWVKDQKSVHVCRKCGKTNLMDLVIVWVSCETNGENFGFTNTELKKRARLFFLRMKSLVYVLHLLDIVLESYLTKFVQIEGI